jgi:hypothetical protein
VSAERYHVALEEIAMAHSIRDDAAPPSPDDASQEQRQRTNVHGTVFAARPSVIERLEVGAALLLIPDPPREDESPSVWVHVAGGDVLGHLPVNVAAWVAPLMLGGGRCQARVVAVLGPEAASWNRIEIELTWRGPARAGSA